MNVSGNIQVDTDKDNILTTSRPFALDTGSRLEIVTDEERPSNKTDLRIEAPEPRRNRYNDADDDRGDYEFLLNTKKAILPTFSADANKVDSETPEKTDDEVVKTNEGDGEGERERNEIEYKHRDGGESEDKYRYSDRDRHNEDRGSEEVRGRSRDRDTVFEPRVEERYTRPASPSFVNRFASPPMNDPPVMDETTRRRRKCEMLIQYAKLNRGYEFSDKRLTTDHSYDEIQEEYEYVLAKKSAETKMGLAKRGIVLLAQGLVEVNNKFDPFGVDMSEWASCVDYEVNEQMKYDEIIQELVTKYSKKMEMPPEIKLLMALGGSFATAVMVEKRQQDLRRQMQANKDYMDAQIQAQVQAQLEAQLKNLSQQASAVPQQSPPQSHLQSHVQSRSQVVQSEQASPMEEVLLFQGPTPSAEEMKALLRNQMIDDSEYMSDAGDQTVDQDQTVTGENGHQQPQEIGNHPNVPVKRKRGRPRKIRPAEGESKTISVPSM